MFYFLCRPVNVCALILILRLSVYISHLCSVFSSELSEFCVLGQIVILFTSGINLIPLISLTVGRSLLM